MTYTIPNWADPITWAIALGLLALFCIQSWLVLRSQTLTAGRKTVRVILNGLLWLVIVAFVLQVSWRAERPATHAMLVGDEVPTAYARTVQDSLHIRDRFMARTLKAVYDTVTLVGQDFPTETLTKLSRSVIRWVPYSLPNQLQQLQWKGVVRQGELQRISGQVDAQTQQLLRVRYGNQTLDSLLIKPGITPFNLQFPSFGQGQSQVELVLGKQTLDTVRFYSRPVAPLRIQFLLDNPDFESKTLADWLGKQGHSVRVSATLSKNIRSQVGINNSAKGTVWKPDIVVTDPAQAASPTVRNAIVDGRAVLFINLSNPSTDVSVVNRALKTRWRISRSSTQETVPAGNNLTAHPYRFAGVANQFSVQGYPIAVQRTAGRVGISLLNETFPLALSGDSLAYGRIWYAVIAKLQPAAKNNVLVEAPVFSHLPSLVQVNNATEKASLLQVGTDTVYLIQSALNRQLATGTLLLNKSGWQPIQDSLSVYVEPAIPHTPVRSRHVMNQFMMAHATDAAGKATAIRQTRALSYGSVTSSETLPDWAWLVLFLVCLTALWVEPKLG